MRVLISSNISILLLLTIITSSYASGELIYSKNGMVVTASEHASKVGVDILQNGGNAIDAAVAIGFALAVTYPSAGNIGGGGFMVIHYEGTNTSIDFRETAPSKSSRDMFLNSDGEYDSGKSLKSWLSIGVPGTVAGLLYALDKYGTMTLSEALQPAIRLAENGFLLDYWLANSINNYNHEFSLVPSSKNIFTNNNEPLEDGQLFVQSDLAKTLKLIEKRGRDGFYKGDIAKYIVEQSNMNGGIITFSDLESYEIVEREPIIGNYKEYTHIGMPPPSAGGIGILQFLKIFGKYSFSENDWGSSKYIHTITEILKYVYSDRAAYLGDSDFIDFQTKKLLSSEYIENIYSRITEQAIPSSEIQNNLINHHESLETTHYSVVDKYGNAVSTTYTLNSAYGNKIVVDGAGFLLNNQMDDFTSKVGEPNQFGLVGSEANAIAPNKRMLSSMSPTIILKNNKPVLIVGSPGGSTIITSTLQVILNVLDFGMNIRDAINAPRFHHQWLPDEIVYEKFGFSLNVIDDLTKRGHNLREINSIGRVEGIYIDQEQKMIWGCSDKRGFGKAVGY